MMGRWNLRNMICCLLAGSDSSKVCFAHASPSVQNFPHKEMGGFKKNVSLHQSLQNLLSTWEIMAVVCDNGGINCQKWGLEGLKGTEENPCRNVCIFSERDTYQRSFIAALCAVNCTLFALFEMSLPSSEMQSYVESITWNRSLILLTDAISQMAHIWNQMLEMGFPQSTLQAPDLPSVASQTAVSCVLCASCSEPSARWPWMPLDSQHQLGLKHVAL